MERYHQILPTGSLQRIARFITLGAVSAPVSATSEHFHPVELPEIEEDLTSYGELADGLAFPKGE